MSHRVNQPFQYLLADSDSVELLFGDVQLMRYVFRPGTPGDESPRPYAHPVRSFAGEVLTNFRPNDHRWHHGLSFTVCSVSGCNFWGGPSYTKDGGYRWGGNHGVQVHTEWREMTPQRIAHALEWRAGVEGEVLLKEERAMEFDIKSEAAWSLRWITSLKNVTSRVLELGQYHSSHGLAGSHYTGLQFRGARDLLDDHGDVAIGIACEGGLEGEAAVHGAAGRWMEWRCQKDATQRRITIRFENNTGPVHWFVRRSNPLAAVPFHFDRDLPLAPGDSLEIDCTITFTDT
jgi:hypothetical protein